jgi:hypothetical protein
MNLRASRSQASAHLGRHEERVYLLRNATQAPRSKWQSLICSSSLQQLPSSTLIGVVYWGMLRHLIHICVLLMLILQGMTPAIAHISDETTSQHCAGHEQNDVDCPCCSDHLLGANEGCAALCSVAVPISNATVSIPRLNLSHVRGVTADRLDNPSYLPLIPPPIS